MKKRAKTRMICISVAEDNIKILNRLDEYALENDMNRSQAFFNVFDQFDGMNDSETHSSLPVVIS